ncbi:MAG: hypothetical protein RL150_49 [Candidatus Parcubacteria bacterium]|jgi:hypothetical protein
MLDFAQIKPFFLIQPMNTEQVTALALVGLFLLTTIPWAVYERFFRKPQVVVRKGHIEIWLHFHQLPAGTLFEHQLRWGPYSYAYAAVGETTDGVSVSAHVVSPFTLYILMGDDVPRDSVGKARTKFITPPKMTPFTGPGRARIPLRLA